jgi:uracil-DNA glycosylase
LNCSANQALKFAKSLTRGEPNRRKVALGAISDKISRIRLATEIGLAMRSLRKVRDEDAGSLPFAPLARETQETVPSGATSLPLLRTAAKDCTACDLYKHASQTVFGEGPSNAVIMLVGEQPGDREDLSGRPFVGPAGKLLDEALREAGIDRDKVYVTNAVKHFKWAPDERGKRRIHKKPNSAEIQACRPWLDAELRVIKPRVLVCMGATAAQALLGRTFSVTRQRGQPIESTLAPKVMATVHPSSILRAQDDESRQEQMQAFVRDLTKVARLVKSTA